VSYLGSGMSPANTVQFRVGTAEGSAATADVCFDYYVGHKALTGQRAGDLAAPDRTGVRATDVCLIIGRGRNRRGG